MGAIRGAFCEEKKAPKGSFDPRSFRWKKSGAAWVLVGCPRDGWQARKAHCKAGLKAYVVLKPAGARCAIGTKRVSKGV
jgi:hypothetical protein